MSLHLSIKFETFVLLLGCTVYDGILLYDEEIGFNYVVEQTNQSAIMLWFTGRIFQVTGLLFLVMHAGKYSLNALQSSYC